MTSRKSIRKRGFTIVEILTVIAIIAILVTITVMGFSKLNSKDKVTRTALENAKSMYSALEAEVGATRMRQMNEDQMWQALYKIPANKEALNKLGSDAVRQPTPTETQYPRLLDGWRNDIRYFAPPVASPNAAPLIVYLASNPDPTSGKVAIRSPDGRAFFASPGPDDQFSFFDTNANGTMDSGEKPAGDDNVYSFGH